MANRWFALLGLGVVLLVVFVAIVHPRRDLHDRFAYASVRRAALPLAALIAVTATVGSLYYSEIVGFVPCRLCWWQRAGMYPLAPILLVAAIRGAVGVRRWVWPFVAWGGGVALYHTVIQRMPSLEVTSCDPTSPCTSWWVREFGFVSIPLLALIAFAGIAVLLAVAVAPVRAAATPDPEVDHVERNELENAGSADGRGGGVRVADARGPDR